MPMKMNNFSGFHITTDERFVNIPKTVTKASALWTPIVSLLFTRPLLILFSFPYFSSLPPPPSFFFFFSLFVLFPFDFYKVLLL